MLERQREMQMQTQVYEKHEIRVRETQRARMERSETQETQVHAQGTHVTQETQELKRL